MHAFLITGTDSKNRQEAVQKLVAEWKVRSFDQVDITNTPSIGIEDIRSLQHRLSFQPIYSPFTVGIIMPADTLTVEAQNALLKTLEEPPPHAKIILVATHAEALLPTILSRCQLMNLPSNESSNDSLFQCFKTLEQMCTAPKGKRLQSVDTITKTREDALAWVEAAIGEVRQKLLQMQDRTTTSTLRALLMCQKQLTANVTPKLVLDHFFLTL